MKLFIGSFLGTPHPPNVNDPMRMEIWYDFVVCPGRLTAETPKMSLEDDVPFNLIL